MVKVVLLILLIVFCIAGWVCTTILFINKGADATEIDGLRTQIDLLGQKNRDFEDLNKRFDEISRERDSLKRERDGLARGLQETTVGAGGDIQEAIRRVRECKELAKQIRN